MLTRIYRLVLLVLFACDVLCLAGCNGGGGGGGEPPIGPNLNGNWVGIYHRIRTSDTRKQDVTAKIKHDGSAVMIKTSLVGIGASLTGTIEPNGEMKMIDPFDGELWTTYFRAATTDRVEICDFLYDEDLGSDSPLQIIDLRRVP